VAAAPAGLTLKEHRDLAGRERRPWSRRLLLALLALFCGVALLNAFGQEPDVDTVAGNGAELEIKAPPRVRGGIYYEMRFEIRAERQLREAVLVLGSGWFEGITVNTVLPGPLGEASRDGDVAYTLGRVPAGDRYVLWLQAQVNPTTVSRRDVTVELYDGESLVARHERTLTVLP
jgi:hypothetical protein